MRKIAGNTKSRPSGKPQRRRKSARARKSAPRRKNSAAPPVPNPPPPGRGKRGEAGYFGYLLRQAAAASRLTLERALAKLGATPPQFLVLTMLKAYPGLSGADLARVAMITPQTVGVIIRNLERDGAIRKTPHPVHGRVLQWSLTRRGLTLLEKCRRHATALERRLAAGLNRKQERAVRRWLSNIALTLQT
jgi:DNA-binding MarR family transcriptional regulator